MKPAATDVQAVVIPGVGHWVAELAPDEMLEALTGFLAPFDYEPLGPAGHVVLPHVEVLR